MGRGAVSEIKYGQHMKHLVFVKWMSEYIFSK